MFEIKAFMWWCGDEECDCSRPEVIVRSILHFRDPGWEPPKTIAVGPFISRGYGEEPGDSEAQQKWLAEAIEWYGLEKIAGQSS